MDIFLPFDITRKFGSDSSEDDDDSAVAATADVAVQYTAHAIDPFSGVA